jgi:hypothetical protein
MLAWANNLHVVKLSLCLTLILPGMARIAWSVRAKDVKRRKLPIQIMLWLAFHAVLYTLTVA